MLSGNYRIICTYILVGFLQTHKPPISHPKWDWSITQFHLRKKEKKKERKKKKKKTQYTYSNYSFTCDIFQHVYVAYPFLYLRPYRMDLCLVDCWIYNSPEEDHLVEKLANVFRENNIIIIIIIIPCAFAEKSIALIFSFWRAIPTRFLFIYRVPNLTGFAWVGIIIGWWNIWLNRNEKQKTKSGRCHLNVYLIISCSSKLKNIGLQGVGKGESRVYA